MAAVSYCTTFVGTGCHVTVTADTHSSAIICGMLLCAHVSMAVKLIHALGPSAGTTPTTPRRMRALHEIPSLQPQAHLGRRPSEPPDEEVSDVTVLCRPEGDVPPRQHVTNSSPSL